MRELFDDAARDWIPEWRAVGRTISKPGQFTRLRAC